MHDSIAERTLITRLRARDATAVADLAAVYGPKIYQLAFRYVQNREDAEEVSQDVLLKVWKKIGAFRGGSALSSWIYRITFNTAMSRLRARRSRASAFQHSREGKEPRPEPELAPIAVDGSPRADERVMRSQFRGKLASAMRGLPPIYRAPVILRDIHGLSTEEASAVLGVNNQTLKSRLHRGRVILREQLGDFAGGATLHRAA